MKILIIPSAFPSKISPIRGIFFKEQAIALKKAGHTVIVVVFDELWSLKKIFKHKKIRQITTSYEDGLIIYRYNGYDYFPRWHSQTKRIFSKRLLTLYRRILKKYGKPDILHAHSSLWGGYSASLLFKKTSIPLVLTEHTSAIGRNLIRKEHLSQLKIALNTLDYLIAVGPSLKKAMSEYTNKNIDVIPNCIDVNKFKLSIKKQVNYHEKEAFRFLSIALLTKNKGMDILIKAFSKIQDNNTVLYIGGYGEESSSLEQLVEHLALKERVFFLGELTRDEVAEQMNQCDVFVLASRYETFGVVYIEALASGKPIIATDCGGPSMIVNEANGILVPVDDVDALHHSMNLIKKNYHKYNSHIIRQDCINRFSEEAVVNKLEKIYKQLIIENRK